MNKKVALYFGTFNPIHIGHLLIAQFVLNYTDNYKIWFVVSPQNPFKNNENLLNEYIRYSMVYDCISEDINFFSSNIEFKLPRPSYTINTLNYLSLKNKDTVFSIIMGSDNIVNIKKWNNYEYILENYKIYVYPRNNINNKIIEHPNIIYLNAPLIELSSTLIREMIKDKKDVSYYITKPVKKIIETQNLYAN